MRLQSGLAAIDWERSNLDGHSLAMGRRRHASHARPSRCDDNAGKWRRGMAPTARVTRAVRFVRSAVEIVVHLNNEPTAVSRVMVSAATPNAEILASCFHWGRDGAVVRLVTEDAEKTEQALARTGFRYQTGSVLLIGLGETPGMAAATVLLLAQAGINVSYSYVSCTSDHQAIAVFKTTDDDRAARLLQVEALIESVALVKPSQSSNGRAPRQTETAEVLAGNIS
ncbi:MAG TPA: hypothetical protein VMP11_07405 [Verrucomicrobiae bacterium]|nr:hypothetical protein [Verrucomicrobiae bacterium]